MKFPDKATFMVFTLERMDSLFAKKKFFLHEAPFFKDKAFNLEIVKRKISVGCHEEYT